tara:strand:+ start:198 stop:341 length:144 start_codon:yes stop_codon:yes gene_type:complete
VVQRTHIAEQIAATVIPRIIRYELMINQHGQRARIVSELPTTPVFKR